MNADIRVNMSVLLLINNGFRRFSPAQYVVHLGDDAGSVGCRSDDAQEVVFLSPAQSSCKAAG